MQNGGYIISITATASGGGQGTTSEPVSVFDNLKIGDFTETYQDFSVPMDGTQVAVQRIYASTDKSVGDFGAAWKLGVNDFNISSNGPLGAGGWLAAPSTCTLFGCTYAFNSSVVHQVTVTEPGGTEEVFNYTPSGGFGPFFFEGTSAFTQKPGSKSLGTLSVYNDPGPVYDFAGNLDSGITGPIYDPTEFIFSANDGTQYLISTSSGLLDQLSPDGDCLNFSAAGVTSYTGVPAANISGCAGGTEGTGSLTIARDNQNRITSINEPDGTTRYTYSYDSAGDLTTVTYPSGDQDIYTYDGNHDLLTQTGPGEPTLTQHYDSAGRLISITDGDGNTTSITNSAAAETFASPNGILTTIDSFDANGNPISQQQVAGTEVRTTTATYDSSGNVASETDPDGYTTSATYDNLGDITSYTDPLGHTTTLTYDALGEPTSSTDPLGNTNTATYDSFGDLLTAKQPSGATSSYTYDPDGDLLTLTNPLGQTTSYAYDSNDNLEAETTPNGNTTTFQSDAGGNIVGVGEPLGGHISASYDSTGNLLSTTDPLGHTQSSTYNSQGLLASTTDSDENTTSYSYDAAGNLTQIANALGGTVKMTYNPEGFLVSLTDPDGRVRTYSYDAFSDLVSAKDPATGTTSYTYDAAGRVLTSTDARGDTTSYTYDANGDVLSVDSSAGGASYSYDADGHLVSVTDPTGKTAFTYDSDGRVTNESSPEGSLAYAYNQDSERTSLAIDGSSPISYSYDNDGNETHVADPAGNQTSFTYNKDDQLTAVDYANGQVTSYGYDAAGRTESVVTTGPGAPPLESYAYGRDADGNTTSVTSEIGAASPVANSYTYDALNRLTTATRSGYSASYTYDPAGNITSEVSNGATTTYSYSSSTGLLSEIGTTPVTHDAAGDLTSAGSSDFSWNALGQLVSQTATNGTTHYSYNGLDSRVSASGAASGSYLWDDTQGIGGGLIPTGDATQAPISFATSSPLAGEMQPSVPELVSDGTQIYVQGPEGVLGQEQQNGSNPSVDVLDAQGSITGVTNSQGALTSSESYGPNGAPQDESGSEPAVGFTGALQDSATGAVYLQSRELEPLVDQFASADSIQPDAPSTGGYNEYSYAANNPMTNADPSGQQLAEGAGCEEGCPPKVTPPKVSPARRVFRGDARSPEEIQKAGGFWPRAPGSGTPLQEYLDTNEASNFVGTSFSRSVAEGIARNAASAASRAAGYVYEIDLDALEASGAELISVPGPEQEIVVVGGFAWKYVIPNVWYTVTAF